MYTRQCDVLKEREGSRDKKEKRGGEIGGNALPWLLKGKERVKELI